jgi:hypothetical protein
MNNFLIGRAAIDNGFLLAPSAIPANANYYAIQDANTIVNAFDELIIGAAIHELSEAQLDSSSDPVSARAHLSSSWGFIRSLDYNASPNRSNNSTQINSILAAFGTDLYKFPKNVDSIKTVIGNTYGFLSTNF